METQETNTKRKRKLIFIIIWESILLFILLATLIYIKRIIVFLKTFGSVSNVFQVIGIVLYFLSLTLLVGYYTFMTVYIIVSHYKNKDWYPLISKLLPKLDIISYTCKILVILLFFFIYIINPCRVVGASMNPTYKNGDFLFTTNLFYSPKKDDVVVFDAYHSDDNEAFYIKRVVAVEGDTISYDSVNNKVLVNGERIKEYGVNPTAYSQSIYENIYKTCADYKENGLKSSYTLKNGEIIVFGDNSQSIYTSKDSRTFGVIHKDDIFGHVILSFGGGN